MTSRTLSAARRQNVARPTVLPVLVDQLTGLLNHRAFQERLRRMVLSLAHAQGHPLSLVILNLDNFATVNAVAGYAGGDYVLTGAAKRLLRVTRPGDTLARVEGDVFAIALPERSALEASAIVERARLLLKNSATAIGVPITFSAGISDLARATDADELLRQAYTALNWGKSNGGDTAWIYDSLAAAEVVSGKRGAQLEPALLGIRALARAIDAKDSNTGKHSDRVAELARGLARALGWTPERIALLAEAALVHDVGKIGIPDAVLLKPSRLDPPSARCSSSMSC
jgi:diguanylate cyclase (GGDEF)-like protein